MHSCEPVGAATLAPLRFVGFDRPSKLHDRVGALERAA